MAMVWGLISLASAFAWFCCALGFVEYAPWVVTIAFVICGLDMLSSAIKIFAGE